MRLFNHSVRGFEENGVLLLPTSNDLGSRFVINGKYPNLKQPSLRQKNAPIRRTAAFSAYMPEPAPRASRVLWVSMAISAAKQSLSDWRRLAILLCSRQDAKDAKKKRERSICRYNL
jgi:hypothetical protein